MYWHGVQSRPGHLVHEDAPAALVEDVFWIHQRVTASNLSSRPLAEYERKCSRVEYVPDLTNYHHPVTINPPILTTVYCCATIYVTCAFDITFIITHIYQETMSATSWTEQRKNAQNWHVHLTLLLSLHVYIEKQCLQHHGQSKERMHKMKQKQHSYKHIQNI